VVAVEGTGRSESPTYAGLMTLLVVLLVIWLVLAILGFVIKGLVWLAIIGIVLFVATAIWGWIRRASLRA
jgi:NADH:ubiquinone oxidoreductase subunit 3 (subunit A)